MFIDFVKSIKINDEFWSKRLDHVMDETLPYQWKALNDMLPDTVQSNAVKNFKMIAGDIEKGEFSGFVFQDSDLYKWLEAVAYSLMIRPDAELEKTADEVIDLIGRTQWEDGYINSSYTLKKPDKRWTNIRDDHELYCAGHMFEAAVAYYLATGKKRFVEISEKFANHIISVIGLEDGKLRAYPGHEEIELALVKLYKVTGEKKYLNQAKYFIDERGKTPNFFVEEAIKRNDKFPSYMENRDNEPLKYNQSQAPVREQTAATGHAVRAMYLYSGMTDTATAFNDESLKQAVRRLWDNVTKTQMYITGGVGSQDWGEAFSIDYDLPNDDTYSETCAQIGLFLWAYRMFEMDRKSCYVDVMERALYNGIISGVSLDGKKYFYKNPLEIIPQIVHARHDKKKDVERQGWFPCACCPPNLARLMLSLGSFVYSVFDDELYVNLYIGSTAQLGINNGNVKITQESTYERDGTVSFNIDTDKPCEFSLMLRIPYWADETPEIVIESSESSKIKAEPTGDGFIKIKGLWAGSVKIVMKTKVRVKLMIAGEKVTEDAGKVALTRGPLVYCFEEIDNGGNLAMLSLPQDVIFSESYDENLLEGVTVIGCKGFRRVANGTELYTEYKNVKIEEVELKAVPYYAWNNRGVGEMSVWLRLSDGGSK